MKCDFCNWNERPDSIPGVTRHLNGNHWGLEDYEIVWRDGEIVLARGVEQGDIKLQFDRPKFGVAPEPPVVKYATAKDINASLEGAVIVNEGTGEIKSTRLDRDMLQSPGDDVNPLTGR